MSSTEEKEVVVVDEKKEEGTICFSCKEALVVTDPNSIIIESRLILSVRHWVHSVCFSGDVTAKSCRSRVEETRVVTSQSTVSSPSPSPIPKYRIQHCNDISNPPKICQY